MTQVEKATAFTALHKAGDPLVLFNIWDAGSAKAVAEAGAAAIATGSWSVAAAQGYPDGEKIPLELLLDIAKRIVDATTLPVSIDFEGGYAREPEALKANIAALIATGAVGLNFEDQIVGGDGLYSESEQAGRVAAIREAAEEAGVPLFINARTDLFLKEREPLKQKDLIDQALSRAKAYADAGASGFFVPGLSDPDLVAKVCAQSPLPVNVMRLGATPPRADFGALGVSRISAGPGPYRDMIAHVSAQYKALS